MAEPTGSFLPSVSSHFPPPSSPPSCTSTSSTSSSSSPFSSSSLAAADSSCEPTSSDEPMFFVTKVEELNQCLNHKIIKSSLSSVSATTIIGADLQAALRKSLPSQYQCHDALLTSYILRIPDSQKYYHDMFSSYGLDPLRWQFNVSHFLCGQKRCKKELENKRTRKKRKTDDSDSCDDEPMVLVPPVLIPRLINSSFSSASSFSPCASSSSPLVF
eukprot:gnl/Hemi2/13055_TR4457_c0_g2_i1.p1 gnl/Hemi2/13055_TR4457_c0_g2~~gnl/Hemi2/13055_TR4457_c0_g2_i1.p1  ORF type:complete len:216 (-),score=66.59 gnl/Hemi2/13055_TR4457_c0_g2_i1:111-758(-)